MYLFVSHQPAELRHWPIPIMSKCPKIWLISLPQDTSFRIDVKDFVGGSRCYVNSMCASSQLSLRMCFHLSIRALTLFHRQKMKGSIKASVKTFSANQMGFRCCCFGGGSGWVPCFPSPFSKWMRERGKFVNGCMYWTFESVKFHMHHWTCLFLLFWSSQNERKSILQLEVCWLLSTFCRATIVV